MLKWLSIIVIAILSLTLVLLGLGYLLNENEKSNQAYQQQLPDKNRIIQGIEKVIEDKNANLQNSNKTYDVSVVDITKQQQRTTALFKQALQHNGICTVNNQCVISTVNFANTSCSVAINIIGAALLAKIDTQIMTMPSCAPLSPQVYAHCQHNTCQLSERLE